MGVYHLSKMPKVRLIRLPRFDALVESIWTCRFLAGPIRVAG
jgi:hypothetical protein